MKAMILSAGYGKRLNPLTLDRPKPLLKIGSETLLSNTLKLLEANDCAIPLPIVPDPITPTIIISLIS